MSLWPCRVIGLNTLFLYFYWAYKPTCQGIKIDPRNQFYTYVAIQPIISTNTREKRSTTSSIETKVVNEEKLTVGFAAFGKYFALDLHVNKDLLPGRYFEKYQESGKYVINLPMKAEQRHCHYQGHVHGIKYSWAAISICNGIRGAIHDGSDLHFIQPHHKSSNSTHLLFKASDIKPQNLSCGMLDTESFPIKNKAYDHINRRRRSTVLEGPYKSNEKSRYVELIIVNDNKQFKEFNHDRNQVFERSKEIANILNGLYSELNIYIALVGVVVWSESDEIKMSVNSEETLDNFLTYRKEKLAQEHPNDNAQLITSMTFESGITSRALLGTICTYAYSGGINKDYSHVVGLVATIVAHSLGHNFGFEHDTDKCQCPEDKCIMASASSSTSTPRHWSSCSLRYLELAFSKGMDHCLKNHPSKLVGNVCGNGFLEEGEECDCGLKEFCDNHCCDASSCRLFDNATCATGVCCDLETCQVVKGATLCRNVVSICDLPEYCDGTSELCPDDTFHRNGEECEDGKAHCFDGKCQSHEAQCKLLWGPSGKMSDTSCYEQNYKAGNRNGNCGYNMINQTYKVCQKDDMLCGRLQCTHLSEKLEFGTEILAILARSFVKVRGNVSACQSAIIDLGLFTADPGMVPNGAKCGDEKTCVNQTCVSVSTLMEVECPYNCSHNGICNSRGNCHCNRGYAPPHCDSPGPGGSIDSGPASDPSGMVYCLKNRPTKNARSVCGNGVLEEGEECDCGLKEFCNSRCCNASSCKLFDNATCAMGGCCDMDTCQVTNSDTLCRNVVSVCDLPEYCNGISEFCPDDTFHRNGEECENGKAYCFDGKCQSHEDQCKVLWGQSGNMSDVRCYEQNYKARNRNGNCGYNRINQNYKACQKDDMLCGMLQCTHMNGRLQFGMEHVIFSARSFIIVRGHISACRSAIVDLGPFTADPGMVPKGAKCGDEMACVNQKCTPVSVLKNVECPYQCSNNGICNNKGNCHCDRGYAPPFCNSPGPGGSIDSGGSSWCKQ